MEEDLLQISDINEQLISSCLYTSRSSNPDLVVRTSGEVRFSDFLLWQSVGAQVYFADVLWPEFTMWDLLAAVFSYQRSYAQLEEIRQAQRALASDSQPSHTRTARFINQLEQTRLASLQSYVQA